MNAVHCRSSLRDRFQHHVLNRIVVLRYRLVRCGIPRQATVRYLVLIERVLKKSRLITGHSRQEPL